MDSKRCLFVFLDIDGVLHQSGEPQFSRAPVLREFLTILEQKGFCFRIILSSAWRLSCPLEKVSAKIGVGISDKTGGEVHIRAFKDDERDLCHNSRFLEIYRYVQTHGIHWQDVLIVDDLPALFTYPIAEDESYGHGDLAYVNLLERQKWVGEVSLPEDVLRVSGQICIVDGLDTGDFPKMLKILGL